MKKDSAVEWLIEEMHKNIDWIPIPMQEQALEMEKNRATEYAEYCMRCDRISVLPRSFDDWKKSWDETFKQQEQ